MSLLFDALKRAQGNEAKKRQTPDASSQPSSGDAAGAQTTGAIQTAAAPQSHVLAYLVGGLVLLAGAAGWYLYQLNRLVPVSNQTPSLLAASSVPDATRIATTAASGVATADVLAALPPTASGGQTGKPWTQPRTAKKPKKLPRHVIPSGPDPLNAAYLALSAGDLDTAEQRYLEVLADRPHEKDALLGLAVIAQRKRQTDRAADFYRQVLHEDMGNAAAAAGIINLSAVADPVSAESQLRELIDIKPDAPELHYALGGILARQSKWSDAQQSYYRACTLEPDNALYAYDLAVSLDHLHQPAALTYYRRVLEKPGTPTIDRMAVQRRIDELNATH